MNVTIIVILFIKFEFIFLTTLSVLIEIFFIGFFPRSNSYENNEDCG